jgi:hypothetical protein
MHVNFTNPGNVPYCFRRIAGGFFLFFFNKFLLKIIMTNYNIMHNVIVYTYIIVTKKAFQNRPVHGKINANINLQTTINSNLRINALELGK